MIEFMIILNDIMCCPSGLKHYQRRIFHQADSMTDVLRYAADRCYRDYRLLNLDDVYFVPEEGAISILGDGTDAKGDYQTSIGIGTIREL